MKLDLHVGAYGIQGKRKTMEDVHSHIVRGEIGELPFFGVFCIFDGHGGPKAAKFANETLNKYLRENIDNLKNNQIECLSEIFRRIDREFLDIALKGELADGTTATVMLITLEGNVIVANVGDSEAVLAQWSDQGTPQDMADPGYVSQYPKLVPVPLSVIHNVKDNAAEKDRILLAGGNVHHGRVGHPSLNPAYFSIAVSRAIGDLMFKSHQYTDSKESGVIPDPEFKEYSLGKEKDRKELFSVLACDGLWSVLKYKNVIDAVYAELQNSVIFNHYLPDSVNQAKLDVSDEEKDAELTRICRIIVELAYNAGSTDNISVMIVFFS